MCISAIGVANGSELYICQKKVSLYSIRKIRYRCFRVCTAIEWQALPPGPVGLERGVLQALWDKKTSSSDEKSLFGAAISKRIAFAH